MKNELEKHWCYFDYYSTHPTCNPYYLIQKKLKKILDFRNINSKKKFKKYWNLNIDNNITYNKLFYNYDNDDISIIKDISNMSTNIHFDNYDINFIHLYRQTRFKNFEKIQIYLFDGS